MTAVIPNKTGKRKSPETTDMKPSTAIEWSAKDLVCAICLSVPQQNQKLLICQHEQNKKVGDINAHKICSNCYAMCVASSRKCPVCRLLWSTESLPIAKDNIQTLLKKEWTCKTCNFKAYGEDMNIHLQQHDDEGIPCENQEKGCTARNYPNQPKHECMYLPGHCEFCNLYFTERRLISPHQISARCGDVMIQCDQCSEIMVPAKEMKWHIQDECPKTKISCRNCTQKIYRQDIQEHNYFECPERIVCCPMAIAGCGWNGKASDIKTHTTNSLIRHVAIAKKAKTMLAKSVNERETTIKKMKTSIESINTFLEYVEQNNAQQGAMQAAGSHRPRGSSSRRNGG